MKDIDRVLQVLIHDVRTPIGVAQGYVRLLRDDRLETSEDRERALSRTMDALGRIARLCDDASEFLTVHGSRTPAAPINATMIAMHVEARVREWQFVVDHTTIDPAARVRVATSAERLAEAIGITLAAVRATGTTKAPCLRIEADTSELRFLATPHDHKPPVVADRERTPFDAWAGGGLTVPLACSVIEQSGGRISRIDSALVVAFPVEAISA